MFKIGYFILLDHLFSVIISEQNLIRIILNLMQDFGSNILPQIYLTIFSPTYFEVCPFESNSRLPFDLFIVFLVSYTFHPHTFTGQLAVPPHRLAFQFLTWKQQYAHHSLTICV